MPLTPPKLNLPKLPINSVLPEIIDTLKPHNRMVLQAPPGAGKTTATPLALLGQAWLNNRQILMLEPRRIAARNSANRMAKLLNEPIGQTVGYQMKQDHCFCDKTKILVVTEGILTRKLQADPELSDTAIVIFDEFHERSIHADLSLALCLQSQQILREDLKILVMSATLDTVAIADLLGNAPIVQSEGRSFPVDINFTHKTIKHSDLQQLLSALFNTCQHVIKNHQGSCLVFLPGVKEIVALQNQLNSYLKTNNLSNIIVTCLYGTLSKKEQDQAIRQPAANIRKFVLSTNIAETSLTIEGIDCVIDAGLERIQHYQASSGMNQLQTQLISHDSAEQRSGRAGRLAAGSCYRLWTKQQDKSLLRHAVAEISHSDLASLTLELANWGIQDPAELQWLDIPPTNHINKARTLLQHLNALDSEYKITEHGRQLLSIGTHPRLAHMMLSSLQHQLAYSACLITAILSEKDILRGGDNASYLIEDRLKLLFRTTQNKRQISNKSTNQKTNYTTHFRTADDFFKRLKKIKPDITKTDNNRDTDKVGLLLAYAYPDRIAKRRDNTHHRYQLSNGKGANIPEFMVSHAEAFLVIANLNGGQNKARAEAQIYLAAEISQTQIEDYHSSLIQSKAQVQWNEQAQRVESKKLSALGQILLSEEVLIADNQEQIQNLLIDAIQRKGLDCLNWSKKALELKQRIQFIQLQASNNESVKKYLQNLDDMAELSDFSDTALKQNLAIWLQPHLRSENSLKQLQKLDLSPCLLSLLSWSQQQHINQLTPEFINVPSGSKIRVDYSDPQQPVLAVRLQEVFGMMDTPLILNGHCQLMMHLLSPARKPMQITQDLNSFWKTTYHEVKKELRGQYKRHYWPDDPFTAEATSKTKKNMHRK